MVLYVTNALKIQEIISTESWREVPELAVAIDTTQNILNNYLKFLTTVGCVLLEYPITECFCV